MVYHTIFPIPFLYLETPLKPFPRHWKYKPYGSSATGLNNQVEKSDYDISLSPEIPIYKSEMTYETAIELQSKLLLTLLGQKDSPIDKLFKKFMVNYSGKGNMAAFENSFPLSLSNAKILRPKENHQVTLLSAAPNMKVINKIGNTSNYEIIISRNRFNIMNTEYLRLHADNNFHIFKFLIILKGIIKNTKLSDVHSLTSYAVNILGLQFLAQKGFLRHLSEFQKAEDAKVFNFPNMQNCPNKKLMEGLLKNDFMNISKIPTSEMNPVSVLRLTNWTEFIKHHSLSTDYNQIALMKSIKDVEDSKFTLTSPKATLDCYNHLRDTKFMIIWFFDWFHTLFDEQVKLKKSSKTKFNVQTDICNIIESRTGRIFNHYPEYSIYMHETYGFVPDIENQRSSASILTKSSLAVIDPFEISHNIIRSDFDKLYTPEKIQSVVYSIISCLTK